MFKVTSPPLPRGRPMRLGKTMGIHQSNSLQPSKQSLTGKRPEVHTPAAAISSRRQRQSLRNGRRSRTFQANVGANALVGLDVDKLGSFIGTLSQDPLDVLRETDRGASPTHDWMERHHGQVLNVVVLRSRRSGLVVEGNGEARGFISNAQLSKSLLGRKDKLVGETIPVMLMENGWNEGQNVLYFSNKQARTKMAGKGVTAADDIASDQQGKPLNSIHEDLKSFLANTEAKARFWEYTWQCWEGDLAVQVIVEGINSGGLVVRYGPMNGFGPCKGFIPNREISSVLADRPKRSLVGWELPVKIMEVDKDRARFVFSNKQACKDSCVYQIGDVVEGVVTSVQPYGAFVRFDDVTGILHSSQVSYDFLKDATRVFAKGDRLKAMILNQDEGKGVYRLSTKKLEAFRGDMLRDPVKVYQTADQMSRAFKERINLVGRAASRAIDPSVFFMDVEST